MRNREIFKGLEEGSAARGANIAFARLALEQRVIAEPIARRGFHLPRIVALPLVTLLAAAAGFGCGNANTQQNEQQKQIDALSTAVKGLTPPTPGPTLGPRAEGIVTSTVTAPVTPKATEVAGGAEIAGSACVSGTIKPKETATANVESSCPKGEWQVIDLRGKAIVGVSGVPSRVTGSFDLADHAIFKSNLPGTESGSNPLQNVLGEPGAFLADRDLIAKTEPQNLASWDAKVKAGHAEYIRTSGPNINFYDLQSNADRGVSWNAEKGVYEFRLNLPKHVIVRIDAEEAKVLMTSASGDRKVRIDMCQSGATRGVDFGHQTLFARSPYEQGMLLVIESPTIPGTQVQILGLEVKDPTAFASMESFLQGVEPRQARPDYPEYFVHTFNMNDLTWGSAESPTPKAPFKVLKNNYLLK